MKAIDQDEGQVQCNHYGPSDVEKIIYTHHTQHKITKLLNTQGTYKLFLTLVVLDDFVDDSIFKRQSKLLQLIYTGGRHHSILEMVSTRKCAAIRTIIRVIATSLTVPLPRKNQELESFLEEVGGSTGKKELQEICKVA